MSNKKAKKNSHVSGNPEKRKLQEMIAEEFKLFRHYCLELAKPMNESYDVQKKSVTKRRMEAIIQYMPVVTEYFKEKYTIDVIQNLFTRFCCSDDLLPDGLFKKDDVAHWSVAAAVWILDELKDSGKLSQINLIDYRNCENTSVIDCVHPPELLNSMTALIQMQMMKQAGHKLLFHSENAEYGKKSLRTDTKPPLDFLSVLELLDLDHVQNAIKNLEKKIWKVIEIYIVCMNKFTKSVENSSEYRNAKKSEYLYICNLRLLEAVQSLEPKNLDEADGIPDSVYECISEYINEFIVENPYETIFAVFYLLAMGSDLIWLYAPVISILNRCWEMLPWGQCDFVLNRKNEENFNIEGYFKNAVMHQGIYALTQTLLPRDTVQHQELLDSLLKYGFSEETVDIQAYLISLASAYHDCMMKQDELHQQEIEKILQGKLEESQIEKQDSVDLQELDNLKAENIALNKRLKEERHKSSILEKEITELKQKNQDEYEELLLYREYMYYLEYDEEEILKDIPVKFPYYTKRKIVCLGGIEPWLKHISEKLKNVTFHKQNVKTNIDTFKYADEIWIQMEGLKHKESLPVTNLAKKKGIPVHFFRCAGVGQCAEQFARHDMNRK